MAALKQHLKTNLFTSLLSLIGAITAANYSCLFQHPKLWEIALWVIVTFVIFYLTTLFSTQFIRKTSSTTKRKFLYFLYAVTTLVACNLFIFPVTFLLTGHTVEDNKHSICCETPLEYGATEYETVKFKLTDGTTISGWYIPASTHKNSLIILIHGHYGDRRATGEWAKIFIEAGYGIYMYDLRGHGESEGLLDYVYSDFSKDLLDIRNQLANKYSVKKFGAVGLSMGAHALINAVGHDGAAFQVAWIEGLWPQAPKDVDVFRPLMLMYSNLDAITQIIFKNPAPKLKPLFDILTYNKTTKIMVVAAGAEDMESSVVRKIASANSMLISTWIISNALHINGISIVPDEYKQKLLDFFEILQN